MKRFWDKVHKTNSCWLWIGSTGNAGYGGFKLDGKTARPSRIAYQLTKGEIGDNHVLHTCDVPKCVNPDHLYLGNHKQNMKDKYDRGRANHPKGEDLPQTKLGSQNRHDIKMMRRVFGMPVKHIAEIYGISGVRVSQVANGC